MYPEKYREGKALLEFWEPGAVETPLMVEPQGSCSKLLLEV